MTKFVTNTNEDLAIPPDSYRDPLKNKYYLHMKNKRLFGILFTVALLLLIPLIAMQFTDEVNWTLSDFIVSGVLLLSTGLMCELVMRKVTKTKNRITLCVLILVAFLLIWIELAVGIFGTPFTGS
jgi:Kef-type K+ transport system membrane component KefB